MGRPKLLLPWGRTSVLGHLLGQWQVAAAVRIAVVCSPDATAILAELDRLSFPQENRIYNPELDEGMFSSILCAARWSGWQASLSHWVIVLGDQPHLQQGTLAKVLDFASEHSDQICQPSQNGRPRHPVVMPRPAFQELATSGCASLKEFLAGRQVACCECDDPGLGLDIDRPEDYQIALALAGLTIP